MTAKKSNSGKYNKNCGEGETVRDREREGEGEGDKRERVEARPMGETGPGK